MNKTYLNYQNQKNNIKYTAPDKRGFSILELLIAFVVMAIAVIPFVNALKYSGMANIKSIYAVQAITIATSKLEELKYGTLAEAGQEAGTTVVYSGFNALGRLLLNETIKSGKTEWADYNKTLDYGKIIGYPNHKMEISISYFPKKNFTIVLYDYTLDPSGGNTAMANPKSKIEHEKLKSRIQVTVKVSWKEPTNTKEQTFTAFSVITKRD